MKNLDIANKLSRGVYKVGFQLKKHSPEILVAAGVVGGIASAVLACKATLKVHEITDETKETIDMIHAAVEEGHNEAGSEYTVEDSKKDLSIVYVQTGIKLAKLYGPAIVLGTVSTISILAGHNILRQRHAATAAAYAIVDKSFKEYRNRVVDRFGKEIDHELRHGVKAVEVEKTVINEKGKEKTVKETVEVIDPSDISEYARFYDAGCKGWEKDPEWNLRTLVNMQHYANDKLKTKGYLFLNDVYEMLGLPRTKAGQVVGWIYDPECPNGDNCVDFGIHNVNRAKNRDFVNGYEPVILLDFNVDGPILDLI